MLSYARGFPDYITHFTGRQTHLLTRNQQASGSRNQSTGKRFQAQLSSVRGRTIDIKDVSVP